MPLTAKTSYVFQMDGEEATCTFPTSKRGPPGEDFVEICPWVRNFVAVVAANILPSNWAKDKVKCGTMTDTKGYKLLLKMRPDESEPEEVTSGATASSDEQSFCRCQSARDTEKGCEDPKEDR